MSDKRNDKAQENDSTRTVKSAGVSAGTARRRMLKKSIGLAPVVLTLSSRPVLAAQCKSPSAWGSDQLNVNSSHHHAGSNLVQAWSVDDWQNNSPRGILGKPWQKLGRDDSNFGDVLLSQIGVSLPSGVGSGQKAAEFLGGGATVFQKVIIVAQLNHRYANIEDSCISLDALQQMAKGTFNPPHLSIMWNQGNIVQYLQSNGIVPSS